ncbi:MAG: YhbY family RNA-binding protein [Granulosicoccus sp.]
MKQPARKKPVRSRNNLAAKPAVKAVKPLDKAGRRYLRSLAHALKPVVRLGQQGLTSAVSKELDGALSHHELVKVKLSVSEKQARLDQLEALCTSVKAECIQQIGHTATLYRANVKKPVIDLSAAKR